MKKYYLLFLFLGLLSNAQIVNIPDTNFKAALLNYEPTIDTNNNGEIEVSEALNVTQLNIYNPSIFSMVGIQAFTNLQSLECIGIYQLTSLDVSSLTNLQTLNAGYCYNLASINTSGLINLQTLNLQNCDHLITIDTSQLINLNSLNCSFCLQLTSLDLSNNTNLTFLDCSLCEDLNSLNVGGLTNLQTLACSSCNLTSLDVSNLTSLNVLDCSYNKIASLNTAGANNITSLACSNNELTSLTVLNMTNLTYLDCSYQTFNGAGITSLNLSGLSQLTTLKCRSNHLSSLDFSNLNNLTYLDFGSNDLTTATISNLTQLTHLNCYSNDLTSLDVTPLIHLTYLDCSINPINSLNVDTLVNLTDLNCFSNNLSILNVSNNIYLESLQCSGNQLTELNLNNHGYLTDIECNSNLLTTIDLSTIGFNIENPSPSTYYSFNNNPGLVYINLKNGLPIYPSGLHVSDCPNLVFICADEANIPNIYYALDDEQLANIQVNSYCTFIPGGIHNTISGTATIDINNNGCDASDYQPDDLKITINDGTTSGATFSNNGDYAFYTQAGSFTLTPQFENPYFTVSPTTVTLNFPTLDGSTQTQNFCITPNGVHNDVDVVLLPITPARPGFDATYQLTYKNKGNQTLSGTVNFSFDDAILDFITANPAVDSQVMNVLSWNYSNLLPFESRTIHFTLNVNAPTETPPVNIDDVLNLAVMIEPIVNDETPDDNVFNLNQIVVGSYDPNDKTCLEGDAILPEKVGDYLHYLIRFQNSGTAPAENVVVKDMIDTNKFDLASLQLTATSHPQVTRITGNKVEFIFENIQLPVEQDNEPGSHGYIAFKIRTKNNLVLGNTVSNTADIYFDYNFPIITNTATTTIVALGVDEFENPSVVMTPNPVKDHLSISADDVITSIQMYDVQGRLITTQLNNSNTFNLDMNQQSLGIYFVKLITDKGVRVEKIIKE